MRLLLLLVFSLILSSVGRAQSPAIAPTDLDSLTINERSLTELAYVMHTDSSPVRRFSACRELITDLVRTLRVPNSYAYPFDSLRGIVVRESPDRRFRIFSWELHVDADQYRHFGAIQMNAPDLQLIPLVDRGDALRENPENAVLSAERWLGYTVYDVVPAGKHLGRPIYFVLGFDRYGKYRRQKILDVLSFRDDGQPEFGAPIFRTYSDEGLLLPDRHRLIFRYSAEANMVLEYRPEDNTFLYEHLILLPGPNGEGPVHIPDGSYHALTRNETGTWVETEKVFHHKYEEAPREAGKAPAGRDLFGRERNR